MATRAESVAPPATTAIPPRVMQEAAAWLARLWADDASAADHAACAQWRAQHPDHESAWASLQAFSRKFDSAPTEAARLALYAPAGKAAARRRVLRALGLVLAAGGIAQGVRHTETWRIATADLHSGKGERLAWTLDDGSQLVIDSGSAVDVRFGAHERLLVLRTGRIWVESAPDPAPARRPLRVRSQHGTVQALGTRFMVTQHDPATHVAVFEGAVRIDPADAPAHSLVLHAGQAAQFTQARAGQPESAPESLAAWTRGLLVADDMPVGELLAELGRHRPGWLRGDPAIAHLKVTGVFSLSDTDRALENLAAAVPVRVVYRTRYWVSVEPR